MIQQHRHLVWVVLLSFASGLPLLFTSEILKAYIVTSGGSLMHLTVVGVLVIPYMISWLWMPLVDYVTNVGYLSCHRLIMLLFLLTASLIQVYGWLVVPADLELIVSIGLMLASVSATQDHLIEKYRRILIPEADWSKAVGYSMLAFRFAIMLSGGAGLVLANYYGWQFFFYISFIIMFSIGVISYWLPAVKCEGNATVLQQYRDSFHSLKSLSRKRYKTLFLLLYRSGIFWFESMGVVFMLNYMHLSLASVGIVLKVFGTLGIAMGVVLSRRMLTFYSVDIVFMQALFLQVGLAFGFYIACVQDVISVTAIALIVAGCLIQGAVGTLSGIWFMKITNSQTASFDFSLWYGISMSGRAVATPLASFVVHHYGWENFFMIGTLISFMALVISNMYFSASLTTDFQTQS